MSKLNKKYHYLDFDLLGLFGIGIISLGYIIFIRRFAELHIQLPFLNFPVFIGEILLFVCLLLWGAKYKNDPQRLTQWHYLIICYFVFVIAKALYGYIKWGPLALRHAALLYYPVFAVFGYTFYRKDLFGQKGALILFSLILAVLRVKHSEYWTLTLVFLGFILLKFYSKKTIKFVMVFILLVLIPYKDFFLTSRMMILSNFLSGLYAAITLPVILNVNKKLRLALTILIGGGVILGMVRTADRGAVRSIVAFKKMAEVIKTCDTYIGANSDHFQMEERKEVKLYNPDKPVMGDTKASINSDKKAIETTEGPVKAELKKIIVQDVKEKVDSFSLGQIDQRTQTEVKQEIKMILDMQLPKGMEDRGGEMLFSQAAGHGSSQIKDESPEIHGLAKDVASAVVPPALAVTQGPGMKLARTARGAVPDKAQVSDAGEANAIIRETFFKQVKQEIRMAPVENIVNGGKRQYDVLVDDVKREMQMAFNESTKQNVPAAPAKQSKSGWVENNNAVFRILIWRDMWRDLVREKPILGFSFGKPFRSRSLEMLHWGDGDWARDGWIEPHNSYLHIIYRTGIVGILLIFSFLFILFKMIRYFILTKSLTGILLCGIIINWFVAANFLVIFELPYTAIPIWTIYGMTFAYYYKTREDHGKEKTLR